METHITMKSKSTKQQQKLQQQRQQPLQPLQNHKKVEKLRCCVQNYDWGRLGQDSEVARLFTLNSGTEFQPDKPYAELWIGTHESGPSFVVHNRDNGLSVGSEIVSLKSWLSRNPDALGDKVVDKWGCDIPFLFKVLSISKALSIQAHPDKALARTLHKLHPILYKDENHKPEMALAMTEFEALCGFINLEELKAVLLSVPEIVELVGIAEANTVLEAEKQDGEDKLKTVLKSVFTRLMTASKDMIIEVVEKLKRRLLLESQVRKLTDKELLVLELERQYPADVGVIGAFFLNHVKLKPGEALYLGPNEPHAYISGECIECMATSDNVVRAGLTPKLRDVQTLCSMLTYKQGFPEILHGARLNSYVTRYLPPFDEFEVDFCTLPQGESAVFPAVPGLSIFLIRSGEGMMHSDSPADNVINEGDIFFAAANTEISVTSASELQLYRAGINSRVFEDS